MSGKVLSGHEFISTHYYYAQRFIMKQLFFEWGCCATKLVAAGGELYPVIFFFFFSFTQSVFMYLCVCLCRCWEVCIVHDTESTMTLQSCRAIYSVVNIWCCLMYTVIVLKRVGVFSKGVLRYLRLQWLCKPNSTQEWGKGKGGSVTLGQNGLMAAESDVRGGGCSISPFLSPLKPFHLPIDSLHHLSPGLPSEQHQWLTSHFCTNGWKKTAFWFTQLKYS